MTPTEAPAVFTPVFNTPTIVQGTVITLPDIREASVRVTIEIEKGGDSMNIIAAIPSYPPVHVGDIVKVSGTLKHPIPFDTDGGRTFAYDDFLRKDNVFGVMQPAHGMGMGRSHSWWLYLLRALEHLKNGLTHSLGIALPEPESSLASGLLVGGKQGLGATLIEAFTRSGMLQIIVLSGYNVMIVASTLMRILSFAPKRIAFGVASFSIACFVLTAGAGSSALRAGLMAFIALAARAFGKQYHALRAVSISVLMLSIWNPLMLAFDPGFQFSFIATLGLIFLATPIGTYLQFLRSALLIELVSTTLAAEIALLPFLLWQTGNLSLVSVFANVIAMPAVPFAMAASAVSAVIAYPASGISSQLPAFLSLPAYIPLAYIIEIATQTASLPYAQVVLPAFPFWICAAAYAGLALLIRRLRRGNDVQLPPS